MSELKKFQIWRISDLDSSCSMCTSYDSNCMTFWKRQNYSDNKKVSNCQRFREMERRDRQIKAHRIFRTVRLTVKVIIGDNE